MGFLLAWLQWIMNGGGDFGGGDVQDGGTWS